MKAEFEFMVMIESSCRILNAAKIVSASPRVSYLTMGAADLSTELG
jgi:citrate lyase beta subunit